MNPTRWIDLPVLWSLKKKRLSYQCSLPVREDKIEKITSKLRACNLPLILLSILLLRGSLLDEKRERERIKRMTVSEKENIRERITWALYLTLILLSSLLNRRSLLNQRRVRKRERIKRRAVLLKI